MSVRVGKATYAGYRTRLLEVAGEGPRLILLHGYSDSADTWSRLLSELAALGRSAVAVDLPGFGEADPLTEGRMLPQLDAFVDELVQDHAARGPVILVGNSLGGCASVRAATRTLPLVGAVTIGDPAAGRWWLGSLAGSRIGGFVLHVLAVAVPGPLFRWVMRHRLKHIVYGDPSTADPLVVDAFLTWMLGQGAPRGMVPQIRGLAAEIVKERCPSGVTSSLLIVHGAKDRIVPVRGSRDLHAATPGSQLIVEPQWGHCPQHDDPGALAQLLTSFAGELAVRPAS
jgi:pimeloyl-ACP methyl ester carboxylesterase